MKEYRIDNTGINILMEVLNAYCDEYHQAEFKDNKLIIQDWTNSYIAKERVIDLKVLKK